MSAEPRVHTFDTPDPVTLTVELGQGLVHVISGDRNDAVVTLRPGDPNRAEDVAAVANKVVEMVGGTVAVRGPKPRGIASHLVGWRRSGSVQVVVEIPEESSLRIDTGVADIAADGSFGEVEVRNGVGKIRLDRVGTVRVHNGAGDVSVEETSGRTEIVTVGDVSVGAIAGDGEVKNNSGRTWIGRIGGNLRVRSANGDVVVDRADGDVTVKTANGEIRLGEVARGSVTIETASGSLEVGIRDGSAAWIDANTKFGRVDNELAAADEPEGSADTLRVRASTSFGDIRITRS